MARHTFTPTLLLALSAAVAFGLTACGAAAPTHHARPAALPSAAPVATASANPDTHACWAFNQATTKGVPASAAGEDTMTWLQSQIGSADPTLAQQLQRFISAWQASPPNVGKISRATRAVKALCSPGTASPTPSATFPVVNVSYSCKHRLTTWLAAEGGGMLHAIHKDLHNYSTDDAAVVNDLLYGGSNTAGDIATWQADLSTFQQDATTLQASPAPSCGGGAEVNRAAADWLKAATAYLTAAQILAASPNMGGVGQADPHMTTGDNGIGRAHAAIKKAASQSGGLFKDIYKGTGES